MPHPKETFLDRSWIHDPRVNERVRGGDGGNPRIPLRFFGSVAEKGCGRVELSKLDAVRAQGPAALQERIPVFFI
jgi:hypothetical protein